MTTSSTSNTSSQPITTEVYQHAQYEVERSPKPQSFVSSSGHEKTSFASAQNEFEAPHTSTTSDYPNAIYETEKPPTSAQYEVDKPSSSAQYESPGTVPPSPAISSLPSRSISVPATPKNSASSLPTSLRGHPTSNPSSPYFYETSSNFPTPSRLPQHTPASPNIRDSGVSFRPPTDEDERSVVLITGCSRGSIGYSLMIAMASKGCRVFGTVRDARQITELSKTLHHVVLGQKGSIEIVPMDVTDSESVRKGVTAVILRAGKVDVLVNSAGVALSGPVSEVDLDACRVLMETNVVGLMGVIQEVVPHMVRRRSGKIINMGSMVGYVSLPWSGIYCASKSAVRAITSSLRMELIPFNIQVSLVCAGTVRTNLIENMHKLLDLHQSRRPTSLYGVLRDRRSAMGLIDPSFKDSGIGTPSRTGTDPDVFAEEIANEIMKEEISGSIMAGKWWWVIIIFLWFPEAMIEFVLAWRYGLKAPKKEVKEENWEKRKER
ncbi:hypothetical protein BC829DRAFT_367347 [Chytridium lagenaria]|nr:hypothetical protein BC829DRAFT_367347 [Chytridium lagenaria]